jgi:cobalt-zinc-cadmium efflux system outer membrane protein
LTVIFSGCANDFSDNVRPRQSLLGEEYKTYRPPREAREVPSDTLEPVEPNGVITLPQALSLALMHNPELRAFSWEVRAAEARALQAGLWPNPELEAEVEEVGGTGDRSGFDGAETTIQLSQLIELGDKRAKRMKLTSLEKEISERDYEAKRLEVFTLVARAFAETLGAQERLALANDMLRLSEELVGTVSQRIDAGKDSPLEKTKAAVVLANTRIRHQQAQRNLEFARQRLAATWAGTSPRFEKVQGRLEPVRPVPQVDELIDLTAGNPDVVRSVLAVDKQKAALEMEKARAVSDVTVSGGLQRFEEANDNAVVFGLSVPLPVSDRNQGGRLEAAYNLARAKEEHRAARTAIQVELADACRSASNAYDEVIELERNVLPSAESVFEASKEGYSQGKLDYLNLLDAQRTLFEARVQFIDALVSYHIAIADVERLIGQDFNAIQNARQAKTQPDE